MAQLHKSSTDMICNHCKHEESAPAIIISDIGAFRLESFSVEFHCKKCGGISELTFYRKEFTDNVPE